MPFLQTPVGMLWYRQMVVIDTGRVPEWFFLQHRQRIVYVRVGTPCVVYLR